MVAYYRRFGEMYFFISWVEVEPNPTISEATKLPVLAALDDGDDEC
jgi:hypothetical protein